MPIGGKALLQIEHISLYKIADMPLYNEPERLEYIIRDHKDSNNNSVQRTATQAVAYANSLLEGKE